MTPRPFRTLLIAIALISLIVSVPGAIFAHSARLSKGVAAQSIVQPEANQPNPPTDFKAGEVLVRFKPHVSPFGMLVTRLAFNATRIRSLYDSPVELWRVPEGQEQQVVDRLRADPSVEYAELNYVYHAFIIPNDPSYGQQWAHAKIQSPAAWDIVTGTTGITIAIIDSGIDEAHPDLTGKIVPGYDFVDSDINPHDLNGHGTHVAGIAAAASNNGVGVAGMNWLAKIMPIRVLDAQGSGYSSNITDGIAWAYQHGAKVINLSLGGPSYSQAMQDAVNGAHAAGSLIVAAMVNCRTTGSSCPNANPTENTAALSNTMPTAARHTSEYDHYS